MESNMMIRHPAGTIVITQESPISALEVLWKFFGSSLEVLWKFFGNTRRGAMLARQIWRVLGKVMGNDVIEWGWGD
jgi:hypothetical protein